MKFIKSKFFIVCVIIAVIIVLVPSVLAAFGQVDIIRSGLKTIAKPFEWCGGKVAGAIDGFVSVFKDYDELVKENEELKAEIEALKHQSSDNEVLKTENEWLREYLELHNNNPQFVLTDADIISHEAGNYSTVLTLNKGAVHGIKNNMPVITSSGLLGHVTETGLDWCKVVSIVETSSTVGVYTDRTGVIGTVEGDIALRQQGKCLMSYAADADIKVGDRVYTSGTGSVYPNGLYIGRIISIEADEATRKLKAVVEPSIDFSKLDSLGSVMIICGYDKEVAQ
ncbi:MAG: rod shape-determining protein MreC [Ruminococcaceae bacterium]|nr:rod shape-determining protein MreC [Oscillospiraceae bacterium]